MNDSNGWQREPAGYPLQEVPAKRRKSKFLAGLFAFLIPGTGHMYLGLMVKGVVIMLLLTLNICGIVFAATGGANVLTIVLVSLLVPILYFYNLFDAVQSADLVNNRLQAGGPGIQPAYGWTPSPGTGWPQAEDEARSQEAGWRPDNGWTPPSGAGEPAGFGGWGQAPAAGGPAPGGAGQKLLPSDSGTRQSLPAIVILAVAVVCVLIFVLSRDSWDHWMFRSSSSLIGGAILIGVGVLHWFRENKRQDKGKG
jgi:TM2 domain-containing membrane protein YozV